MKINYATFTKLHDLYTSKIEITLGKVNLILNLDTEDSVQIESVINLIIEDKLMKAGIHLDSLYETT
jgi:hypothetical protein